MAYLHGAYGEIGESKVASVTQADVVAAYIGHRTGEPDQGLR